MKQEYIFMFEGEYEKFSTSDTAYDIKNKALQQSNYVEGRQVVLKVIGKVSPSAWDEDFQNE